MRTVWVIYYAMGLFHVCYRIFIGIMGIANCRKIRRAGFLLMLGIGDIVIMASSYIFMGLSMGFYGYMDGISGFTSLLGFALPILYIIGAVKNKASQSKITRGEV